jgi:polar amino acid transport system substrate-binding protein
MKRKWAGAVLANLLAILLLAGCSLMGKSGHASDGSLRVGVAPDYRPISFKENGHLAGIEIDLAQQIGKETGRRIKFVELPFSDLMQALLDDRVDVLMAGLSVTEERSLTVRFIEPYMHSGQMALIRAEDIQRLGGLDAIYDAHARIGFEENTTGAEFAREVLSEQKLEPYTTVDDGVRALRAGEIDVFIHDAPTVWRIGGATDETQLVGLYAPLTEESLAWAVRPTDEALAETLDALVRQWKKNGTLQGILNRWISQRVEVRPPKPH